MKPKKPQMLKIPVQLVKRMGDGPIGEMRWQVEVPEQFMMKGTQLEAQKGMFFVIMGPFQSENEIEEAIK